MSIVIVGENVAGGGPADSVKGARPPQDQETAAVRGPDRIVDPASPVDRLGFEVIEIEQEQFVADIRPIAVIVGIPEE